MEENKEPPQSPQNLLEQFLKRRKEIQKLEEKLEDLKEWQAEAKRRYPWLGNVEGILRNQEKKGDSEAQLDQRMVNLANPPKRPNPG